MSKSGPMRKATLGRSLTFAVAQKTLRNGAATVRELWISNVGRSVTFAALTCDFILKSQIVQSGSAGGPAVLADGRARAFHPCG